MDVRVSTMNGRQVFDLQTAFYLVLRMRRINIEVIVYSDASGVLANRIVVVEVNYCVSRKDFNLGHLISVRRLRGETGFGVV